MGHTSFTTSHFFTQSSWKWWLKYNIYLHFITWKYRHIITVLIIDHTYTTILVTLERGAILNPLKLVWNILYFVFMYTFLNVYWPPSCLFTIMNNTSTRGRHKHNELNIKIGIARYEYPRIRKAIAAF